MQPSFLVCLYELADSGIVRVVHGIVLLVYTPLKRVGPIAVLSVLFRVHCHHCWLDRSHRRGYHEAMIIFGIQFIWQFPHFWAIAWVADDDYKKAGFKLLPSGGGGKDFNTAIQIMVYTMFLIPLGFVACQIRDDGY